MGPAARYGTQLKAYLLKLQNDIIPLVWFLFTHEHLLGINKRRQQCTHHVIITHPEAHTRSFRGGMHKRPHSIYALYVHTHIAHVLLHLLSRCDKKASTCAYTFTITHEHSAIAHTSKLEYVGSNVYSG